MGDLFTIQHLLLILLIVVLVFGTKKLRNIGADLGGAVKGFKEGMAGSGGGTAGASGAEAKGEEARPLEQKSAIPAPEVSVREKSQS